MCFVDILMNIGGKVWMFTAFISFGNFDHFVGFLGSASHLDCFLISSCIFSSCHKIHLTIKKRHFPLLIVLHIPITHVEINNVFYFLYANHIPGVHMLIQATCSQPCGAHLGPHQFIVSWGSKDLWCRTG